MVFAYYALAEPGQKNTSIYKSSTMAGVMDTDDNWKAATMVLLWGGPDQISEDSVFTFINKANILANRNFLNKMLLFETRISVGPQTSIIQSLSLSDYIDLWRKKSVGKFTVSRAAAVGSLCESQVLLRAKSPASNQREWKPCKKLSGYSW